MTYNVNDIFTDDEEYSARAQWCNENGCYIKEIEPLEDGSRQFKICAPAQKSDDEVALEELEQQEATLNAQIAQLKDQLLTATLADDTEQVEAIKAEYQNLVGV